LCPAGSLAEASDPAGPNSFLKKKLKERERDLFSGIFILKSEFFYVVKNIYTNLVFRIPGFRRNCGKYTYISKFVFLCIAYNQYPNMFWTFFFLYKKIYWKFSKMCFRMDFLNTTKLFFCISGFYNMFVKFQRVLANIPKNIKILFCGEFIYYSPLMFG